MFGAFESTGHTYYVPHQGDDRVTSIDTTTRARRDLELPPEACLNAHALRLSPHEQTAVVACEGNHVLPGTVVFRLPVGTVVARGAPRAWLRHRTQAAREECS